MRIFIVTLIIFISSGLEILARTSVTPLIELSNEELLDTLDKTLTDKDIFEKNWRLKLEHLKSELATASDNEERFWTSRNIYNEYRTYDSDSALYYANLGLKYAEIANRQKWIDEMNIYRTYIYAATGLLEEAQKTLNQVNPDNLDINLLMQYYEQLLFLYTHRDQYIGLNTIENPYSAESQRLLDFLLKEVPKTNPNYCWFKGWYSLQDVNMSKEAISELLPIVGKSKFESVQDAKNAWVLSRLYERIGDDDNKMKFLILSSIADARTNNKEIASLEEIANIIYHKGDLKRANDYINYCLNCANDYKSRVRVGKIADLQHKISNAYQKESDAQSKSLKIYFITLIIFVILLLVTLAFSYYQNRQLRLNKIELNKVNSQLSSQIEEQKNLQMQLKDANGKLKDMYSTAKQRTVELSEINYKIEKYIANIFEICSSYINKLEDFRRNIHRLLIERKFDEISKLARNPELSNAEIKELYHNFDTIFLSIYPNFVEDFNSLLMPEERIILKKGELLNTELRIYALVRLGLNESPKIARLLHCSVRTVYNTRQRIRNKSKIPKEFFAETVRNLSKEVD